MSRIAMKRIESDPMFAAYTRGFRDRLAGVPEHGNPFEVRTDLGDSWELAWGRADTDVKDFLARPITPKEKWISVRREHFFELLGLAYELLPDPESKRKLDELKEKYATNPSPSEIEPIEDEEEDHDENPNTGICRKCGKYIDHDDFTPDCQGAKTQRGEG